MYQHHFFINIHNLVKGFQVYAFCFHLSDIILIDKFHLINSIFCHAKIKSFIAPCFHFTVHIFQCASILRRICNGNSIHFPCIMHYITCITDMNILIFRAVCLIGAKSVFPVCKLHSRNLKGRNFFVCQSFCLLKGYTNLCFHFFLCRKRLRQMNIIICGKAVITVPEK